MYIPAQIEMYYDEFRKMLDFETMNPDSIIGIFKPNTTMIDLIMGGPKNQSDIVVIDQGMKGSGIESLNFAENLQIYLLGLLMFVAVLMVLGALATMPCLRAQISKIIRE